MSVARGAKVSRLEARFVSYTAKYSVKRDKPSIFFFLLQSRDLSSYHPNN